MSGGANIVEQYAGADVPARIEFLIKYYPKFIRLVEWFFGHYHDNRNINAEEILLYEQIIRIS